MDPFLIEQTSKDFKTNVGDSQSSINALIEVPSSHNTSFREICYQIINSQKILCNNEEQFSCHLKDFIDEQTDELFDETVSQSLDELHLKRDDIFSNYDLIMKAKVESEKQNEQINDRFAQMYHNLVHSGFLTQPLLNLEFSNSLAVQDLITSRDTALNQLRNKQALEMENAIQNIAKIFTEDDINSLSAKHFEDLEKLQSKWNDTVAQLKKEQKQEFCDWLKKVYEDFLKGDPDLINKRLRSYSTVSGKFNVNVYNNDDIDSNDISIINLEESFTINLGAQMKTTHNLKLISMDILDFCKPPKPLTEDTSTYLTPNRIQTAMSLYSNSLSALVLLVDKRINSFSGNKLEFANICLSSTEFHFLDLENQIDVIRKTITKNEHVLPNASVTLDVGDFYVTKHSNLSEVHVVYHLISDDLINSSDINSRHPVILGLRNILKLAYLNDIKTISIPLLLINEMTDELTIQWCLRRAELVLKCVKGFMIEMSSLSSGSDDNRNVLFVVPKGISEELFANLSSMLPNIFRLSNPLILKSNYGF